LIFEGELRGIIDLTMPFSQTRESHTLLENGEMFGKIVLLPE